MLVQRRHHSAELFRHRRRVAAVARRVAWVGAEKTECVVAPVVDQALVVQVRLVQVVVDRQQLQRGDAERLEVRDRGWVRQAGIRSCQRGRQAGQQLAEAFDVQFVEHLIARRDPRRVVPAGRCFRRRRHASFERTQCVVARVERARAIGVAEFVAVVLGRPGKSADDLARPGVEQQLVGVEAVAVLGLVWAVRAQAIDEAGADAFDKTVEDAVGGAVQRVLLQLSGAARVEDAEFDLRRVVGEDGDVDATVSGEGAEGFGAAILNLFGELHCLLLPPARVKPGCGVRESGTPCRVTRRSARGECSECGYTYSPQQTPAPRPGACCLHAGIRKTVASGGMVSSIDCARPWLEAACTCSGASPLPRLLPP